MKKLISRSIYIREGCDQAKLEDNDGVDGDGYRDIAIVGAHFDNDDGVDSRFDRTSLNHISMLV